MRSALPGRMGEGAMEQEIFENILQHPEGTWTERIARELNHSRQTVGRYVGQLEAAGRVRVEIEGQMKRVYPADSETSRKKGPTPANTGKGAEVR
jgi:predicted transcriptional regulator